MTKDDLLKEGERVFGKDFHKIAVWLSHQLSEKCFMNELLSIIDDLNEEFYESL